MQHLNLTENLVRNSSWAARMTIVLTAGVMLVSAACSDEAAAPEPDQTGIVSVTPTVEPQTATQMATPTATVTAEAAAACEKVGADLADLLERHLTAGGESSLRGLQAVRSDDFEAVWFVAGDLEAPGLDGDGDVATWSVSGAIEDGYAGQRVVLSVDAVAAEFSDWFEAETTDFDVSRGNHGFDEVHDCVEAALG